MKTYRVELERDESGAWMATVPEVAGCHTQGRTVEEASDRIKEALRLWVEDADEVELVFEVSESA